MRGTFIRTLTELAETDDRLMLLTGDLGYLAIEPFAERFPDRFLNVGVAEQNMLGIATGLAEAGFIPFVYSIATFAALRPYEFIRNGPILHQLPVRIVGVGGGFEYGLNGLTHFALEDIGIMRVQPDLNVFCPADFQQTRTLLQKTWDLPGPSYYRIGKNDQRLVPGLDGRFEPAEIQIVRAGQDVCLVATGSITSEAVLAADQLAAAGVSAAVAVVPELNPAPVEALATILQDFKLAFTVEAHYIAGGLGSLVAEIIAERGLPCQLTRCGVGKTPSNITGIEDFMNHQFGISSAAIVQTVLEQLQ